VFHQPRIVWIDTTLLNSLKERDYLSGLAEVIKYGMIADPKLFNFMRRERERIIGRERGAVRELITRSCQIKSRIVSRDEREAGLRKVLNYGHTLGHAIEAVTGYRKYRHGEAISIGMHFAASLAFRLGECERSVVDSQKAMIESFRLPATPPKVKGADLLKSMELDKKVEEGKIYFILPLRIGRVVIKPVERGLIKEVIHSMV
jgi:3-dehydroquinate synthase